MIAEYQKTKSDAIGMSGLLVKSTIVMKDDLITMNERGLSPTVILGGAALNRKYVEQDLRAIYKGTVHYGADAFDGLRIMDKLVEQKERDRIAGVMSGANTGRKAAVMEPTTPANITEKVDVIVPSDNDLSSEFGPGSPRSTKLAKAPNLPTPPFLGSRVRTDFDMAEVFKFINERTLFSTQWQFRKGKASVEEYERQMNEIAKPAFARLKELCLTENLLRPAVTYGFFPASSDGTTLTVYQDDGKTVREKFELPRQDYADHLCLADYIEPLQNGKAIDHVAFMAVTVGHPVSIRCKELYEANKYQDYLFLHGLSVESAEALAEYFHREVRKEWGIGRRR